LIYILFSFSQSSYSSHNAGQPFKQDNYFSPKCLKIISTKFLLGKKRNTLISISTKWN